jgi:hypothetical protein
MTHHDYYFGQIRKENIVSDEEMDEGAESMDKGTQRIIKDRWRGWEKRTNMSNRKYERGEIRRQ